MRPQELYQRITDTIIKQLEEGVAPWVRPWTLEGGGIMPRNYSTKRYYSGINVVILWDAQIRNGWPTSNWLTYKQARAIDAQVRKGEKGTQVIYTNKTVVGEGEDERLVSFLKSFTVFNQAQIDGLPLPQEDAKHPPQARDDNATRFIEATKADIRHGGDRAFYRMADDFIMLPDAIRFESYEHYLATALHECVHWSGHQKRLNRALKNRFGTKEYAAEELVAELGAAFLCAHLGVEGRLRHAEYIGHWLELLKDDPKALLTASSKASQAAEYLRAFSTPSPA